MNHQVTFAVLGPIKIWRDGVELPPGPPKQRAVLALLLLHAGQPVSLSRIVDVLWPSDPPHSAVNVVHRHVGTLRKLLEPGLPPRAPGELLVRRAGGYAINVDATTLDLLRFRDLAHRAREASAGGTSGSAVELFTEALALWRGEAAQGVPQDVRAHPVFSAVDSEYLATLREGADLMLASGEPEPVLPLLQRAIAQHPLDESLHARLVQALADTGRQAEAFALYDATRSRLAEQLGIDPGPELSAARARLLRQEEAATGGSGDGPPAQMAEPAVPPRLLNTPPNAPLTVRPTQLPPDLRTFVGRKDELARITGSLDTIGEGPGAASVVISAIDGMAGVGKTILAVHLAHRLAHRFPDGQLYVNLRGFDPSGDSMAAAEAMRSFLIALGVPARQLPADLDSQVALYRSLLAGRRVLVVLDNARDSQHVRPLMPGSSSCLVIITSRTQLRGLVATHGARPLTLGLLSREESHDVLVGHLGRDRIAADPDAVEEIIDLCGRLPLALAIIAARAATQPHLPLASIAAELRADHGSLDVFAGEDPYTDLRTVFSWSCNSVGPDAARLLRLLSLHPGPDISVAAAASLAALPLRRVRALLATLAGAHLLTQLTSNRFAFHDLLKVHAAELSRDSDDEDTRHTVLRRLLDHYLHSAYAAASALTPNRIEWSLEPDAEPGVVAEPVAGQEEATAWLDRELPVLLSAVGHAERKGFLHHAWLLAQTLELYLDRRGRWQDQVGIQETAVDAAVRLRDPLREAQARRSLGFAYGRLAQDERADVMLRHALRMFTELDDAAGQARTRRSLAFLANVHGLHSEALRQYAEAFDLYRYTDHRSGQASVLNETGWTYIAIGDYEQAVAWCSRAVSLHQTIGDTNGEAAAWDSLGLAHHHLGRHLGALSCYRRALKLYQRMNDRYLEADTLLHMGDTHDAQGARTTAVALWRQAVRILDDIGHPDAEEARLRLKGGPTEDE
ncbi:BTAD domain-containing putative transcriptional regulator [Streptomyces sp. NPDC046197]|uniref:AfsR/SARP family transcriptional regulator n=1 Tax=Streptomyces sp. NPDC046197 TaxID=3154337 RepID=UPI0033D9F56A